MASTVTLTPEQHQVYNELDKQGLLFGLPRVEGESNASYKRRLLDVRVNIADSTYRGLINGITRELGLSLIKTMTISPKTDTNGNFLTTLPAVEFIDTKCNIYTDYANLTKESELDRFETYDGYFTIQEIANAISGSGYFDVTIENDADTTKRSMTIFNQISVGSVTSETLDSNVVQTTLLNKNIIDNTITISSTTLFNRVNTQALIRKRGDYYIDLANGIIYSYTPPNQTATISYQYILDKFIVWSSPVIIHRIYTDDFKTKMFEQATDGDGNTVNGTPTRLGANIINELLSVYPLTWGE